MAIVWRVRPTPLDSNSGAPVVGFVLFNEACSHATENARAPYGQHSCLRPVLFKRTASGRRGRVFRTMTDKMDQGVDMD